MHLVGPSKSQQLYDFGGNSDSKILGQTDLGDRLVGHLAVCDSRRSHSSGPSHMGRLSLSRSSDSFCPTSCARNDSEIYSHTVCQLWFANGSRERTTLCDLRSSRPKLAGISVSNRIADSGRDNTAIDWNGFIPSAIERRDLSCPRASA